MIVRRVRSVVVSVESMGVVSAPYYNVLSLNVSTDVKPGFISRRKLVIIYLNEFVHGKVHLLGWGLICVSDC